MIHNGIEYGLMQAFAEGFDILQNANNQALPAEARFDFDLSDIAEVWRRGSVISSWLLDLTASALAADPKLSGFEGVVEDSGEGRWTIMAAIEETVPADVLSAALYTRFRSRADHTELRDRRHVATCLEFGPRFLHSTGQAYKGGPDSGVFLQITAEDRENLVIPGHRASFGVVKDAQARGDLDVLLERGRRALRVHLKGELAAALKALHAACERALA